MIIIDFKCRSCSKIEEFFIDKQSKAMRLCSCGGLMDRQLSTANIHLDSSFPGAKMRKTNA